MQKRVPFTGGASFIDAQVADELVFIDEICLSYADALELIAERTIEFGIQRRPDLWKPEMIAMPLAAGCVSIEAGAESISEAGLARLDKKSGRSTAEISQRLMQANGTEQIPFDQANLPDSSDHGPDEVERWRAELLAHGIRANKPVPMLPESPIAGVRASLGRSR